MELDYCDCITQLGVLNLDYLNHKKSVNNLFGRLAYLVIILRRLPEVWRGDVVKGLT